MGRSNRCQISNQSRECSDQTPGIQQLENRVLLSANLLTNGDFSRGATGFSTGLARGGTSLVPVGTYVVGTDPHQYHPGGANFGDHTTGSGKMLLINGSIFSNVTIWRETIATVPGVAYSFSGWAASWATDGPDVGDVSPAQPQVTVNGKIIAGAVLTSAPGDWTPITGTWLATSGRATITLTDLNRSAAGNDSAYDDFSVTPLASIRGTAVSNTSILVNKKTRHRIKPMAGVTVFLDTNGDGILDDGEISTVTSKSGAYAFTGLQPGLYQVRETIPTAATQAVASLSVPVAAGKQALRENLWDVISQI